LLAPTADMTWHGVGVGVGVRASSVTAAVAAAADGDGESNRGRDLGPTGARGVWTSELGSTSV